MMTTRKHERHVLALARRFTNVLHHYIDDDRGPGLISVKVDHTDLTYGEALCSSFS